MKKLGLLAYGEMADTVLKALSQNFSISWIVLPPSTRLLPQKSSIIVLARKLKTKIYFTNSHKELYEIITKNQSHAVVVSSYNKIIPQKILSLGKHINVHIGDLPRYRGRATVNWAIINGREEIALTIHQVVPELDAGNIYAQYKIPITQNDTVKTVYDKINALLSKNISSVVQMVIDGYVGLPQRGSPTYCCTRIADDGLIEWSRTSKEIYDFVRALIKPYPGAFTFYRGKRLIVWEAEIPQSPKKFEGRIPGRVCHLQKNVGIEVLTGDSSIIITKVSYGNKECNAAEIIKSVKESLGINWIQLYEAVNKQNAK